LSVPCGAGNFFCPVKLLGQAHGLTEISGEQKGKVIMKEQLLAIKVSAEEKLSSSNSLQELEELRVSVLGKKGELTQVLRQMGGLSAEERPVIGALANEVREAVESALTARKTELLAKEREEKLKKEVIDVTMAGKKPQIGGLHPITKVLDEVKNIFLGMGFSIAEGPDVELDYYNFEALNIPKEHPARDTQDTFYVSDNVVLRTQTSPMQIRVMEHAKPPIRIIAPGRVYRSDAVDATHSPVFHQIEGLVVDKNITFADLKGTLNEFCRQFFGENIKTKFRPHHFPFTEPSAEVDVSCFKCGGKGCRFCKGEGWIEILGCGQVHPHVLEMVGIDTNEYTGFAFGVGLERLTLLKYEIDDMRLLYENDLRFLNQF